MISLIAIPRSPGAGIGRQAWLRAMCPNGRAGSTPAPGTFDNYSFIVSNIDKGYAYLILDNQIYELNLRTNISSLLSTIPEIALIIVFHYPMLQVISIPTVLIVFHTTNKCPAPSDSVKWNQILEVDRDSKMKRTQQRPLVTGDLTLAEATTAATIWGLSGTSILYLGTDPITTALGLGNIGLY